MYKKHLWYLIVIGTVARLLIAHYIEFGNDEVYYYTYARHLQENYFDHPPGVAWLIRLFTFNLYFQTEVFVRLGAIIGAAAATWLAFKIGILLKNERTGWYAALLYNTSVYSSIIAGTFILPDSPQVVFWLASIWLLLKIVIAESTAPKNNYLYWLAFGVASGLCIMCKIHGIFLWVGLVLYMLVYNRRLFLNEGFYMALAITAVIASPILTWNIQNNFVTWRYHSNRVTVNAWSFNTSGFIQALAGQFLYNNPINICILVAATAGACRAGTLAPVARRLLLFCGLPIIITVTAISVFRDVLPHWSGPGFVALSFISAAFLDQKISTGDKCFYRGFLKSSVVFIVVLALGGVLATDDYPGTLGSKNKQAYGDGDFTLDMYGWRKFGKDFNNWLPGAEKQHLLPAGIPFVCSQWFPAAHIDYYVAGPEGQHVVGVGALDDLHHYAWLNHYSHRLKAGDSALCIIPSNYYRNANTVYGPYFQSVTPLHTFTENRHGKITRYFNVYLLNGYKGNDEANGYKIM